VQNIRVNIHFLQHDDGTGSFGPFDDGRPGTPGTATTGYDYAQGLLYAMNGQMNQNPVLSLAPGSALTPVAKRIRWVLDGVFFDKSTLYRRNAGTTSTSAGGFAPLCVRGDSVINLFLTEEFDWPYVGPIGNTNSGQPVTNNVANRGYVWGSNQAICNTQAAPAQMWAVAASPWTGYVLSNRQPWQISSTLNHELCHLLGLNHPFQYGAYSWGECPDAPMNANCWNLNEPAIVDCDASNKVSNNLMDYNAAQAALAPCQINIMQDNLNTCLKSRYVYKCSNCLPPTATFDLSVIPGCMPVPIWFDSRAAVNYDWYKLEIDQVTAAGALIAGTHYESTVFQQPLGRTQLDAIYPFGASSTYRVQFTTHAYCGLAAVRLRTVTTPNCVRIVGPQRATAPAPVPVSTPAFPRQ